MSQATREERLQEKKEGEKINSLEAANLGRPLSSISSSSLLFHSALRDAPEMSDISQAPFISSQRDTF